MIKLKQMNKKAYSFSGWMEAIVFSVLLVLMLGLVFAEMNTIHDEEYNLGLGTDSVITEITGLQEALQTKTDTGEVSFVTAVGMTLTSSWDIITSIMTVLWNFLTGSWVETIAGYMRLPPMVGILFRALYFLSIGFVLLKILFKVRT